MTEPLGAGGTRPGARLVVEAVLAAVGVLVFVFLARAYVNGGQVVSFDDNVARWVAADLPTGLEWPRASSRG